MSADLRRVEKLLGMLGSEFDGERANAAKMIAAIAKAERITLPELMARAFTRTVYQERIVYRDAPPREPQQEAPKRTRAASKLREMKAAFAECLARTNRDAFEFLTEWERNFVVDIVDRDTATLTEKQAAIVDRIIEKAKRGTVR